MVREASRGKPKSAAALNRLRKRARATFLAKLQQPNSNKSNEWSRYTKLASLKSAEKLRRAATLTKTKLERSLLM